ncbi:MAG TPA: RES family NAD+ phosphorylase [Chitinophagaceae bacterium]|nr:RES family NAD+ phosphorylase [Chitinophagaceae bacterium]
MKVYRISKCQYVDDLSGKGAANYSGRWHSKGTYILYTASSPSLALLESVVHISKIVVADYCMICLEVPEDKIQEIKVTDLPDNWNVNPSPDILKFYGDAFIRESKFFALKLASAIMPEENNLLLNPNHPDFKKVKVEYKRNIPIDERLVKNK